MTTTTETKTARAARKPRGPKSAPTKSEAATTAPTPATKVGKLETLIGLLRQPGGVTIEALTAVTGWQAHSVRGAISGAIKKKQGLTVLSEKTDAGRVYRIPAEAGE